MTGFRNILLKYSINRFALSCHYYVNTLFIKDYLFLFFCKIGYLYNQQCRNGEQNAENTGNAGIVHEDSGESLGEFREMLFF